VLDSREGKNALYHNLRDGTFKDVAPELGIADINRIGSGVSMSAVWGDYDNDGYEDLLLIKWGRPELYHNDAGRGFTRVTEQAGLPPWINANAAIWLDFDGDGLPRFVYRRLLLRRGRPLASTTTKIMLESFEYARNGGRKYLFRNSATGGLKKSARSSASTAAAGARSGRRGFAR
jgi:hypothetical protein